MPPLPTQITEADNAKHEIHYTLDRPKDVVVAAYTKVEGEVVKFFDHLHKVVALVPVHIVALIKRIEGDSEADGHAETPAKTHSRRGSADDE